MRAGVMRVIVTGSREWTDRAAIFRELNRIDDHISARMLVVHGDCPSGADAIADAWAREQHLRAPDIMLLPETHPADWRPGGILDKTAGFKRNEKMAALGADLCLAFWDGKSPGTLDMIRRAVAHAITVRIVPAKRKESPSGDGGGTLPPASELRPARSDDGPKQGE